MIKKKTIFTSPVSTFAFKSMSFELCDTLTIFQTCMITMFLALLGDFIEIFMDDFFNFWLFIQHMFDKRDERFTYLCGG